MIDLRRPLSSRCLWRLEDTPSIHQNKCFQKLPKLRKRIRQQQKYIPNNFIGNPKINAVIPNDTYIGNESGGTARYPCGTLNWRQSLFNFANKRNMALYKTFVSSPPRRNFLDQNWRMRHKGDNTEEILHQRRWNDEENSNLLNKWKLLHFPSSC